MWHNDEAFVNKIPVMNVLKLEGLFQQRPLYISDHLLPAADVCVATLRVLPCDLLLKQAGNGSPTSRQAS